MSCSKPFEIRASDSLVVLDAELTRCDTDGETVPIDLEYWEVTFTMVNAATGDVVVDEAAAEVVIPDEGRVRYEFLEAEVVTPGIYWGTFRVIAEGQAASFPVNPKQCVIWIHGERITAEEAYDAAR